MFQYALNCFCKPDNKNIKCQISPNLSNQKKTPELFFSSLFNSKSNRISSFNNFRSGKLSAKLEGRTFDNIISATPIGLLISRSAYFASNSFLSVHKIKPIEGFSSGCLT